MTDPPQTGTGRGSTAPGEIGWQLAGILSRYRDSVDDAVRDVPRRGAGLRVLRLCAAQERHTQAELGRVAGIDRTTMTAIVDALAEEGLVVRRVDPRDRRVNLVSITDAGRRRLNQTLIQVARRESTFLLGLSDDACRALVALVDALCSPSDGAGEHRSSAQ